jgi:protein-S-isoprenylcysteine O-methyltransferase Ste14
MPASPLLLRSLVGTAALLGAIAAAYFLAAGTPRPWQGWVYLAVVGACSLAITLWLLRHDRELLERRLEGGASAEIRPLQKLVQAGASVGFLAIFVLSGLDLRFHGAHFAPAVSLLSDVLVAAGFGLVFLVFRANSFTSATIEVAKGQFLVSTGPYAWVRHPMYSGALLLLAATPPALGSVWGWAGVAAVLVLVVLRLRDEEQLLRRDLAGYEAYCARVRHRLVPGLW